MLEAFVLDPRLAEARRKSTAARQQRNTEQQSVKKGKAAAPSSSRQSQLTAKDRVGDHLGDVDDKDSGKAAAAAATATDTPPQPVRVVERLDPALFAATFAARSSNQKGGGGRDDDDSHTLDSRSSSALEIAAERRRRERRRKGIVRGRDGQPMRRVDDTTIRVLPSIAQQHPSFLAQDGEGNETEAEETLVRPPALDPIEARPSSKNRAFKKRKLGLHGAQGNGGGGPASRAHVPKVSGGGGKSKASKRDEDDPLGLEDPAFMKGGEFEGMGLSGTKKTQRGPGGGSRNGLGKRHTELRRADAGRRTGACRGLCALCTDALEQILTLRILTSLALLCCAAFANRCTRSVEARRRNAFRSLVLMIHEYAL